MNPCAREHRTYRISSADPSATWVLLHNRFILSVCGHIVKGNREFWVRRPQKERPAGVAGPHFYQLLCTMVSHSFS